MARHEKVKGIRELNTFSKTNPTLNTRVNDVFRFIAENLCIDEELNISSIEFEALVGSHEFGRLLKSKLFICSDDTYISSLISKKAGKHAHSKKYKLNPEGIIEVSTYFNIDQPDIAPTIFDRVSRKFHQELSTGEFKYKTNKHRDYHYLSSGVNKHIRNEILAKYDYTIEYDIISSGPTILYNEYLKIDTSKLIHLELYLQDSKAYRMYIAEETGSSYQKIKELITAFCYNASFSTDDRKSAFEIAGSKEQLDIWLHNPKLKNLHKDIQRMYKVIKTHLGYETAGDVAIFYMSLEEQIRDTLISYCQEHNIRKFIIHDAICVNKKLDIDQISDRIEKVIGYRVKFETTFLE